MTLTVAEVLSRAADLIEPEGRWTQGSFARDKAGERINAFDRDAWCFCMKGAIGVIGCGSAAVFALLPVLPPANGCPIAAFNDAPNRTQAEVVSKLREAAALAKERGV